MPGVTHGPFALKGLEENAVAWGTDKMQSKLNIHKVDSPWLGKFTKPSAGFLP